MPTRSQFSDIVARTRAPGTKSVSLSKSPKAKAATSTKPTTSPKSPSVTKPSTRAAARSRTARPPASFTQSSGSEGATSTKGFQFVHEECYARTKGQKRPTKGGGRTGPKKASARDVIGEVLRETPAHYRHLTSQGLKPEPPVHLYGLAPSELPSWYEELVAKSKLQVEVKTRKNGRQFNAKQRISTTILGASVASYPGRPDHDDPHYAEFCRLTVAWARQWYGDNLVGVYAHTDEPHGHLHILFANGGKNVKPLMAGHRFVEFSRADGIEAAGLGAAYKRGAKWLQDQFHKWVSEPLGLLRKSSNPKPRLSWRKAKEAKRLEEQQAAEAAALEKRRQRVAMMERRAADWINERVRSGEMSRDQAVELMTGLVDKPDHAPRV